MIQANELRIGNWVENISNVHRWQITLSDFVDEYEMGQSMFHMKPIPLTPEILENCKLNKQWYNADGNTLYFRQNDPGDFIGIDCKYLHQLQNLYFALTGTELEISL